MSIECAGAADGAEDRQDGSCRSRDRGRRRCRGRAIGRGPAAAGTRRRRRAARRCENSQSQANVSRKLGDDRPFDAKVQVADRVAAVGLAQVALADVHAAGEAERAIDDEDLAVVAQVGIVQLAGNERRQERGEGNVRACAARCLIEGKV